MILLLDAHVVYWSLVEPDQLGQDTLDSIARTTNEVLVSAASIWELEIKRASGKLTLEDELIDLVDRVGYEVVPIIGSDASAAARLPMHHRDPFDRMLVAQASRLGATIVSRDRAFDAYGVDRLAA